MPWPRCSSHLELLAFKKGFNLFLKERVSPSGPPIPFERVHFRRPIFQETNNKGGGGGKETLLPSCPVYGLPGSIWSATIPGISADIFLLCIFCLCICMDSVDLSIGRARNIVDLVEWEGLVVPSNH